MKTLSVALSLWKIGLVKSEELIAWVDARIQASENPDEALVQLSLNGPETCLKRPIYDFPSRPLELAFAEEFGLRVAALDLGSEFEVNDFINWAASRCMGENLDDPVVIFCYELEDFYTLEEQIVFLRNGLPPFIPQSISIAHSFYAQVPGLKSQSGYVHD